MSHGLQLVSSYSTTENSPRAGREAVGEALKPKLWLMDNYMLPVARMPLGKLTPDRLGEYTQLARSK